MRSAENQTPTWLRFQQLDSASEETATSSSQGRVTRIQILQISSRLQDFQRFHKNPQLYSKQTQVARLPVQWMPSPQYPLQYRKPILLLGLQDNPGHREEVPKVFPHQGLDCRIDLLRIQGFLRVQTLVFQKGRCCDICQNDTIDKIELFPSIVMSSVETNSCNNIQLFS